MDFEIIWSTILIPLLLAIGGGVMLYLGWRNRQQAEASQSWFPASGAVNSATLKKHYRKGGVDYEPKVEYSYTIMGTPYEGKRLCFGTLRLNQKKAWEKLGLYPKNGKVIVYYNPDKPTESVLEREAPGVVGMMVGGGLMLLIGVGLFVFPYLTGFF